MRLIVRTKDANDEEVDFVVRKISTRYYMPFFIHYKNEDGEYVPREFRELICELGTSKSRVTGTNLQAVARCDHYLDDDSVIFFKPACFECDDGTRSEWFEQCKLEDLVKASKSGLLYHAFSSMYKLEFEE